MRTKLVGRAKCVGGPNDSLADRQPSIQAYGEPARGSARLTSELAAEGPRAGVRTRTGLPAGQVRPQTRDRPAGLPALIRPSPRPGVHSGRAGPGQHSAGTATALFVRLRLAWGGSMCGPSRTEAHQTDNTHLSRAAGSTHPDRAAVAALPRWNCAAWRAACDPSGSLQAVQGRHSRWQDTHASAAAETSCSG